MTDRSLQVAIAGETIPYIQGGLGYFLVNAIHHLSATEPSWRFTVLASSSFSQLAQIQLPNVRIVLWDRGVLQRVCAKVLRGIMPGHQARRVSTALGKHAPTRWIRANWGDLQSIWKSLGDVDVIWAPHYSINPSLPSLTYDLRSTKIPIVLTVHDIHPVYFPDDWAQSSLDRFWLECAPFSKTCNYVITHTHFQKEAIAKHIGVAEDRIGVIPIPPLIQPTDLLQVLQPDERSAFLQNHSIVPPYALYPASSTHSHKNHVRLILAWHALSQRLGPLCPTLVCTAKGHLWPALKSLIEALSLEGTVVFTDTLDTMRLATLYDGCSFVIVPTLYEGGGSGPVAEALMVGKPVACSNIPQIMEQMDEYHCRVITFDPTSISAIADAAGWTQLNLEMLQTQARENKERLLVDLPRLWSEWARFYAERLRVAAETRL
jgi:glycosyltransferase involved in cell wall biosynthesis